MKADDPGNTTDPIDELYTQACRESRDSLKAYGLDLDSIETEVNRGVQAPKRAKKRRILLRVLLIAACVFLLFNGLMFALDFPWAKNYQFGLRKLVSQWTGKANNSQAMLTLYSSVNITEAQKSTPFHIPVPQWLPDGYKLDSADVETNGTGYYFISTKYRCADDQILVVVSNDVLQSESLPSDKEAGYEKLEINTLQVYAQLYSENNTPLTSCHFYNEEGLHVFISGKLDKQSLTQLIESLD